MPVENPRSDHFLQQSGPARVGPWPKNPINYWTESKDLLDDIRMGRSQPTVFQPCLRTLNPTFKRSLEVPGAVVGDLAYNENGPCIFNGRVWKDKLSLNRLTLVERFEQLPRLNAAIRQSARWTESVEYNAASVDKSFFIASKACIVTLVTPRITVAGTDGGAVNVMIEKVPSGTAIGSGSDILAAVVDLKSTANTNVAAALHATAANYTLAIGDSLALDFTGTLTSATGSISVELTETGLQESGASANPNVEVLGTNASAGTTTFPASTVGQGGVTLTTGATANDQMILTGHQDTNQSAWAGLFSLVRQPLFETRIRTATAITSQVWWAGFRLTNPAPFDLTTDAAQVIVWYNSSVDGFLHWSTSVAGTDYTGILTDLAGNRITVAVSTSYSIEIGADVTRMPYAIVNGKFYLLGTVVLGSINNMIWTVGVETLTTAAKNIVVRYVAPSQEYV